MGKWNFYTAAFYKGIRRQNRIFTKTYLKTGEMIVTVRTHRGGHPQLTD